MKKRPLPPGAKRQSENAKKAFKGIRFDVYQWEQKQFDGSVATFESIKRNDTVVVMPIVDGKIVMVEEQQPHWDKPGFTLVAGMVENEEDLKVAARRELEEETGLIFENFDLVHIETNSPSIEWFVYTFIATGYKGKKEKKLDAGEKNKVVKVSFDKLLDMTRKNKLFYQPMYIRDMIVRDKIKELKESLKNPKKFAIKL